MADLQSADPLKVSAACGGLRKLGPKAGAAVPELLRRQTHAESYVRNNCFEALKVIVGGEHEAILLSALDSPEPKIRYAAVRLWALYSMADNFHAAEDKLIALLEDEVFGIRKKAAETLGIMRSKKAIPKFQELQSSPGPLGEYVRPVMGLMGDPAALEELRKTLRDGDRNNTGKRAAAARVLGEMRDPSAFEPLLEAATSENWELKSAAIQALGRLGDKRAIPFLIWTSRVNCAIVVNDRSVPGRPWTRRRG